MTAIAIVPLFVLCAQVMTPLPRIEVTSSKDVAQVAALNDALSALSTRVTGCVNAGQTPEACQCRYPQQLNRLKKAYRGLIVQHPEWKDQILSYQYVNKEGRNISGTLVLANLRRQIETLKCQ